MLQNCRVIKRDLNIDEYRYRLAQLEKSLYTSHLKKMIDNWQEMGNRVKQAFAGQVSITQEDQLLLYPLTLLEKAQSSLYVSVVWQQRTAAERGREHECIEKQYIKVKLKKQIFTKCSFFLTLPRWIMIC